MRQDEEEGNINVKIVKVGTGEAEEEEGKMLRALTVITPRATKGTDTVATVGG